MRSFTQLTRRAASAAAVAATAVTARAVALSEASEGGASDAKPKPCLQLTMLPEASEVVLERYAALYGRVVADRVLIRPCMTEAHESVPLRPLPCSVSRRASTCCMSRVGGVSTRQGGKRRRGGRPYDVAHAVDGAANWVAPP